MRRVLRRVFFVLCFALFAMTIAPRSIAESTKAPAAAVASDAPKDANKDVKKDAKAEAKKDAVHLAADKLDIDIEAKRAVLTGHVRLERGSVTVRAPAVEVRYDELPNVTWAKATGGVVAEVKGVRAEAPEVELDLAKQTLSLRGGVRVARGAGWISAESATIDLLNAKVSLSGVEGVLPAAETR